MPRTARPYLLGDSLREKARLRAQARLWDPVSRLLFDRLNVRPGLRVLEVGPGEGSLHLELRRRTEGPVDAVEPSAAFLKRLASRCEKDDRGEGKFWNTPLRGADLPKSHYDLIFARWVFLFLPDPETHVRQLARALKPNGLLALQDYHRESLVLVPRPREWTDFLAADRAFFASSGADASVASRLPALFQKVGLDIVAITPTVRMGRPGTPAWRWLSDYFLGIMDRYGKFPPFSRKKALSLRRAWLSAAKRKTSLLIAPTVLDVVGRRRG